MKNIYKRGLLISIIIISGLNFTGCLTSQFTMYKTEKNTAG